MLIMKKNLRQVAFKVRWYSLKGKYPILQPHHFCGGYVPRPQDTGILFKLQLEEHARVLSPPSKSDKKENKAYVILPRAITQDDQKLESPQETEKGN